MSKQILDGDVNAWLEKSWLSKTFSEYASSIVGTTIGATMGTAIMMGNPMLALLGAGIAAVAFAGVSLGFKAGMEHGRCTKESGLSTIPLADEGQVQKLEP